MKVYNNSTAPFDSWLNDQFDFTADESGSFDDNWIVSADDLFGAMELPSEEVFTYRDQVA